MNIFVIIFVGAATIASDWPRQCSCVNIFLCNNNLFLAYEVIHHSTEQTGVSQVEFLIDHFSVVRPKYLDEGKIWYKFASAKFNGI